MGRTRAELIGEGDERSSSRMEASRIRTPRLGMIALAGTLAMGASGCSLILDFGDSADAGTQNMGADAFIIPMADCAAFEPNNTIAEALVEDVRITAPSLRGGICSRADRDFYIFSLPAATDVIIELAFDHRGGDGDLGLRLYDTEMPEQDEHIDAADSLDDDERIERTAAGGDQLAADHDYAIEVFSATGKENVYTLSVQQGGL